MISLLVHGNHPSQEKSKQQLAELRLKKSTRNLFKVAINCSKDNDTILLDFNLYLQEMIRNKLNNLVINTKMYCHGVTKEWKIWCQFLTTNVKMLNNGRERSQSSTNVNSEDQNEGPNNSWRRNKSSRFAKQNQDQVSNRLDQLAFVL